MQMITILDLIVEMAQLFEDLWNQPIEFQAESDFEIRAGFRRSIYNSDMYELYWEKIIVYRYLINMYEAYMGDSRPEIRIRLPIPPSGFEPASKLVIWYMTSPFEKFLWSSKNEMIGALFYVYLQIFSKNWKLLLPPLPSHIPYNSAGPTVLMIRQEIDNETFHNENKKLLLKSLCHLILFKNSDQKHFRKAKLLIATWDVQPWGIDHHKRGFVLERDDRLIFSANHKTFYHLTCALFLRIEK